MAAVVGGPADGAVALPAGLGHDVADEIHGNGEEMNASAENNCMCDQPLKEMIFLSMSDPIVIITQPRIISCLPVDVW